MNSYLLSQILVIMATLVLGITYFLKDKVKILLLCILYGIFYGTHYLLLGAYTGMAMNLVSLGRNCLFFENSRKGKKNSRLLLYLLLVIAVVFCIITYKDYFSLISLLASLLSTYSIWQDNVKIYKIIAIPVSICFIAYAIHIKSLFAIITEFILLLMEFFAIVNMLTKYRKKYKL